MLAIPHMTASKYPRQFYVDAWESLRSTLRFGSLADRAPDVEAAVRKLKSAHVYAQTHGLPAEAQRRAEDMHRQAEGLLTVAQSGKDPAPADREYAGNYHPRLGKLLDALTAEKNRPDEVSTFPTRDQAKATADPTATADPAATAPAVAACGYKAFTKDQPAASWMGMSYGSRETALGALAVGAGAGIGALIPGEHRARNAAIGAFAGLLLGSWKAYSDYQAWKAEGGTTGQPGACEGHESPVDKTVQKASSLGKAFGDVAFAANNVAGAVQTARGFLGR